MIPCASCHRLFHFTALSFDLVCVFCLDRTEEQAAMEDYRSGRWLVG